MLAFDAQFIPQANIDTFCLTAWFSIADDVIDKVEDLWRVQADVDTGEVGVAARPNAAVNQSNLDISEIDVL